MSTPEPANEMERLQAVKAYHVLDTPPEKVFDDLARLAAGICGTDSALVSLVDKTRQWFKAKVGWDASETSREVAFCSHTILSSDVLIVPDALQDERFATNPLVTADPNIRFYAGMPLINRDGHALGTVCVLDKQPRQLSPKQEDALRVLGAAAVAHLELRRAFRELEEYRTQLEEMVQRRTNQLELATKRVELTYDETLGALGAALDLRDNETAGHSCRVTRYGLEIARALGCSEEELKQIERGSYLHDIGKIGIPDAILSKPGKLTEEEKTVMETHVRIGYDLVRGIAFLAPAAQIVLAHHERYDGMGYPQGLAGEGIPLGPRIFAVADTLDAITSDRPYRSALPFAAACEEIKSQAGRQFDPKVVEAFLSISEEVWMRISGVVKESCRIFGG